MANRVETFVYKILADTKKAEKDVKKLDDDVKDLTDKPHQLEVKADTSSLKGFTESIKTNMAGAEGAFGKVKAAGSTVLDGVKNLGPAALLGAAGAVSAFAVKAVNDFVAVSKAALDMGDAIGTSTEDASRWIAVADDFGVGADQLEGALGKVAKSLDSEKWSKYGIATRDAAGQARDANDVILDALDMLSKIPNETERARVGTELFGKGYANLAPIIGHTREEYEDMLGAVEDGQVITDEEAEKAERMRRAQDALADALRDVTIGFGEMVAEMAPAIEGLADLITLASDLDSALPKKDAGGIEGFFGTIVESARRAVDPLHAVTSAWADLQGKTEDDAVKKAALDVKDLGSAALEGATGLDAAKAATESFMETLLAPLNTVAELAAAYNEANEAQEAFFTAQRAAADSSYAVAQAGDDLVETILGYADAVEKAEGDTSKLRDIQDDTRDSATKYADAQVRLAEDTAKANGATLSAKDSQRLWLSAMLEAAAFMDGPQKAAVLDYIARVEGIPPEKVTEILADPDNQSIDSAAAAIDAAAKDRNSEINVTADVSAAQRTINNFLAGNRNPFQIVFGARTTGTATSSTTSTAPAVAPLAGNPVAVRSGGGTTTNNITINSRATSGRELTRELDRWARLNGRRGR